MASEVSSKKQLNLISICVNNENIISLILIRNLLQPEVNKTKFKKG